MFICFINFWGWFYFEIETIKENLFILIHIRDNIRGILILKWFKVVELHNKSKSKILLSGLKYNFQIFLLLIHVYLHILKYDQKKSSIRQYFIHRYRFYKMKWIIFKS
jgi:hypothetical protein